MGVLLSKKEIAYENHNFWWFYLLSCRGFDEEKELNLDDAIKDVLDEDACVPGFAAWYQAFCPDNEADADGYYQNPNTIAGELDGNLRFAIEFHAWHTTYYLNDLYIGNLGGHFEAWFFTLDELMAFDRYDFLFLLLLPMVGIRQEQRKELEAHLIGKLKAIPVFRGQEAYLAKCIVNGLVMNGHFEQAEGVGITCTQNHSVRNIKQYPRYTNDVAMLNQALAGFVSIQ